MPNLRNRTWRSTDPAVVSDAQFWEDHLISDEDADFIQELKEGGVELGGHTIVNPQGQSMPKESKLKFLNAQVTDDPTNQQTIVDTRGEKGDSATITIGATTTLPAGSDASVTNVGTSTDAILNFSIPRGADGGTATWGNITGNIQDQTDLQTALNNAGKVKTVNNIQPGTSGDVDLDASDIPYTNTTSGLTATDVQDAIDELSSRPSSSVWGSITGTLANQTDLQTELNSLQADIDSKGTVKSVNNVTPDAQGNVNIISLPIVETIADASGKLIFTFTKKNDFVYITMKSTDSITLDARAWVTIGALTDCQFDNEVSVSSIDQKTLLLRCQSNGDVEINNLAVSTRAWIIGTGIALARE